MQEQINQLNKKVEELSIIIDTLRASSSIPFDIGSAFSDRLSDSLINKESTKDPSTETQAVDEGGTATYDVAKPMRGFEQAVKNGETRYYPYY